MWVGMGNPCDDLDRDLFYASTTITIGNGECAPFWDSPWLNGMSPLEIAPLIFEASHRKHWTVTEALKDDAWLSKIKLPALWTMDHIRQIVYLWVNLRDFQLHEGIDDDIIWKHTASGHYSAASAYKVQFLGLTWSVLEHAVWKAWAPPKVKFFARLAIQNRIWTADRLAKRGWPNCGLCPLCKRENETVEHLFFKCRFSLRLWGMIKAWLQLHTMDISSWGTIPCIKEWWTGMSETHVPNRKAMTSLTMLLLDYLE